MPERGFNSEFWDDDFIAPLPLEAKMLFMYLFTSPLCNPAGVYKIALSTISGHTGLPLERLPELFKALSGKIIWVREENTVWVKNFIKRQAKSPKFLVAAAKYLSSTTNKSLVEEVLKYNKERYSIVIPYHNSMGTEAILTRASVSASDPDLSCSVTRKGKEGLEEKGNPLIKVYEQHIGMVVPYILDSLNRITKTYPEGWFEAAVKETLDSGGPRSLKYIERILERWKVEGFKAPLKKGGVGVQGHEAPERYLKEVEKDANT